MRNITLASFVLALAGYACWMADGDVPRRAAHAQSQSRHATPRQTRPATAPSAKRMREGDTIDDVKGLFARVGDRLVFSTVDGKRQLIVLENLMLERVARRLDEQTDEVHWTVSGTVTEFREANYLLISHATTGGGTANSARKVGVSR